MIIGEMTDASDLVAVSASYVLSIPDPAGQASYWVAAAGISDTRFIVMDAVTGGQNNAAVTIGEMKSRPFGIAKQKVGNNMDVYISGIVTLSPPQPFIIGQRYYATTRGDLITSDNIDYRYDAHPDMYIVNGNTIVSMSAFVGTAISTNTLALHV